MRTIGATRTEVAIQQQTNSISFHTEDRGLINSFRVRSPNRSHRETKTRKEVSTHRWASGSTCDNPKAMIRILGESRQIRSILQIDIIQLSAMTNPCIWNRLTTHCRGRWEPTYFLRGSQTSKDSTHSITQAFKASSLLRVQLSFLIQSKSVTHLKPLPRISVAMRNFRRKRN